jgi:hypothetical protein
LDLYDNALIDCSEESEKPPSGLILQNSFDSILQQPVAEIKNNWGKAIVEKLSKDLEKEFP